MSEPWQYSNGTFRAPTIQQVGAEFHIQVYLMTGSNSASLFTLGKASDPEELWLLLALWFNTPRDVLASINYVAPKAQPKLSLDDLVLKDLDLDLV